MKKNIRLFAGALALATALTAVGISYERTSQKTKVAEDKNLSSAYSQIESQENNLSSVFEEESSAASSVSVVDEEYVERLSKFIINFDFSNTILPVEKTFNEDGRELFKIGHDYEFYEVDKTYPIAGMSTVVEFNEEYAVLMPGKVIYPDGREELATFNGCVMLRKDSLAILNAYEKVTESELSSSIDALAIEKIENYKNEIAEVYENNLEISNSRG